MGVSLPVYLDNHATTPVDPRVVQEMLPYFTERFGNAASRQHEYGWHAEAAVGRARGQIASLIGCDPREIIFTSGATESINLALKGVAGALAARGKHVVTASTEHHAVLDSVLTLERHGFSVTRLPVDRYGMVSPDDVRAALTAGTILVSIMLANNEIGTIHHVAEIGAVCAEHGVVFHTDATQAVGKIPVDVRSLHAGLMSFSAHKLYGPKGIGCLFIDGALLRDHRITPQIDGGGHERGLRSGTLNVPGIVGFGAAAALAAVEMSGDSERTSRLRDRLVEGIVSGLEDTRVNGHPDRRLPNNASLTFPSASAERVMMDMKDIAVSSGSACSSASEEPSHVLKAIGLRESDARSTLRFGLGRFTTAEEIEYAIERVVETVGVAQGRIHRVHTEGSWGQSIS